MNQPKKSRECIIFFTHTDTFCISSVYNMSVETEEQQCVLNFNSRILFHPGLVYFGMT